MTSRVLAATIVAVVLAGAAVTYVPTHDITAPFGDVLSGRRAIRWPPPRRVPQGAIARVADVVSGVAKVTVGLFGIGAFAGSAALAVSRGRARSARSAATQTWELALGRDDVTNPFRVQEAFEGIAGSLSSRWYRRLWSGQDHVTLEIEREASGDIRFLVAGTANVVRVVRAALKELYPDVLLREVARPELPVAAIVRMKKARTYVLSLQSMRDYRHAFAESLVAALDTAMAPVAVQLVLTPAPAIVHRRARDLLKRRERSLARRDQHDELDPGVTSVVESKELRGALKAQHRSLLYFELRIVGCRWGDAERVAGLFSQLRAENELIRRHVRVRRGIYARRVASAMPNPLPGTRVGVISTPELAGMWHLPRARVKEVRLNRSTVRRALAPRDVDRQASSMLMSDEHGPVGIALGDRQYGHALVGGQGGGKSSVMARSILTAAQNDRAAIVVFDPKGPLAELALGLIPRERTVHYLDLGAPEVGFNPLTLDATPALRASLVVRAMIEANPPGAIQAASDSFLRQAIAAVCAVEAEPTFWHVYRMFDFDVEAAYRRLVVERLFDIPGTDFARNYWRREFPALIRNRAFAAQGLNPPRNKLERLISTPEIDVMLRHPVAIDIGGIIERGEVLVVSGAKAAVGEDNVVFVMQLLLQLLHRSIQAQQTLPPLAERRRVALFIDEAHNLLTPSVATMLAEGRSAGLEASFAWQYSAQIIDHMIRSGLQSLLQSISIFRMREVEDARSLAGLAMEVYSDRISADLSEQERLRFSADDIVRLPAHRAINLWIVGGVPRPGFVASSLPMEALRDGLLVEYHAAAQRGRGAQRIAALPDPLAGLDGNGRHDVRGGREKGKGLQLPDVAVIDDPAEADVLELEELP